MKAYIVIGLLVLLAAAGLSLISWVPDIDDFDRIGLPNDIPEFSDRWKAYLILNIFVALSLDKIGAQAF